MDREPKLPDPQIDPHQVAEAILDAAITSKRDVTVGVMAKVNTTISKIVPGLADKMTAKQVDRQQYDQAPRDPEGALYHPSGGGKIYGHNPAVH
jgi:hypothetical protein